jgi:hypothetical protein
MSRYQTPQALRRTLEDHILALVRREGGDINRLSASGIASRFFYFHNNHTTREYRPPSKIAYENRSTIMTSNRPLEEWGKLLGDVPTAGAILDRFLHHAQTIAITGRSYRLKDHAAIAGKEDKNKKAKSKPSENSTSEPAS